jgi:hypothetical protein
MELILHAFGVFLIILAVNGQTFNVFKSYKNAIVKPKQYARRIQKLHAIEDYLDPTQIKMMRGRKGKISREETFTNSWSGFDQYKETETGKAREQAVSSKVGYDRSGFERKLSTKEKGFIDTESHLVNKFKEQEKTPEILTESIWKSLPEKMTLFLAMFTFIIFVMFFVLIAMVFHLYKVHHSDTVITVRHSTPASPSSSALSQLTGFAKEQMELQTIYADGLIEV